MNERPEGWELATDGGVRFHYFRNGSSLCDRHKSGVVAFRSEQPQKELCCRECYKRKMREP